MEGSYPLANLPMITDPNNGDKHLAESTAILQYVAQMYKPEAGPTIEELSDFMCVLGNTKDIQMAITMPAFTCKDVETFKEKIGAAKVKHASKLNYYEIALKSSNWVFGNRVTYLDFLIADMTEKLIAMETDLKIELFSESQRPVMTQHMERVLNLEGVKEWRASDKFMARPFYPSAFAVWS